MRDPRDLAIANLVVALAPALCLTRDRDLTDYGLGTADWLDLVFAVESVSQSDALIRLIFLLCVGSRRLVLAISRRTQPWQVCIALVLVGFGLATVDDRRALWVKTRKGLCSASEVCLSLIAKGAAGLAVIEEATVRNLENSDSPTDSREL